MNNPLTHKPAANTAAIIDIAAVDGVSHELIFYGCAYDVAPAAGMYLTIESPVGTILQQWPVTAAGPAPIPTPQIKGAKGAALRVKLTADSGGAVGCVNAVQR